MEVLRRMMTVCAIVALVVALPGAVLAQGAAPNIKWSQMPDMVNGFQFSSESKVPSIVADDWLCEDGLPVTDIHWWGGYWMPNNPASPTYYSDSLAPAPPGGLMGFTITIWSDVPADPSNPYSYSQPGQILKVYRSMQPSEVLYGSTSATGRPVYYYSLDISNDPFLQTKDQIYWISIVANASETDPKQWGWHESNDHWNDAAVQDFDLSGWYALQNNIYDNDMAFQLTTIPEPGSLLALSSGVLGLAGLLIRRRRA